MIKQSHQALTILLKLGDLLDLPLITPNELDEKKTIVQRIKKNIQKIEKIINYLEKSNLKSKDLGNIIIEKLSPLCRAIVKDLENIHSSIVIAAKHRRSAAEKIKSSKH